MNRVNASIFIAWAIVMIWLYSFIAGHPEASPGGFAGLIHGAITFFLARTLCVWIYHPSEKAAKDFAGRAQRAALAGLAFAVTFSILSPLTAIANSFNEWILLGVGSVITGLLMFPFIIAPAGFAVFLVVDLCGSEPMAVPRSADDVDRDDVKVDERRP